MTLATVQMRNATGGLIETGSREKAGRLELLRLPAVMARTGKSKTGIYTDPTFPKPVKISATSSAWVAEEVDEWIVQRIAERDDSLRSRKSIHTSVAK